MDKPASLFITQLRLVHLRLWACLLLSVATAAVGLAQEVPADSGDGQFSSEIPASYSGSGSFFSRKLGTAFRFGYHNQGYGTQDGVVTLGTMKVFSQEGSTIFLDGQATLSDGFGGGYNTGVGYRTLSNLGFGPDPLRINGISLWADGQSTGADNFFNQLGIAVESLGDSFDLRFQGNFPLERTKDSDRMDVFGATPTFEGDALLAALQQFTRDTALTVLDLEGAKRIRDLEAWAFASAYQLTGGGIDSTGYRAGVRGYAVPDVSVSLQVTDDDIYHTNVMFGLTWFVGRTNRCNQPCGTLLDRFREPVLRNDYIATTQQIMFDAINPLTDAVSEEQFVFVHVDSNAPAGGDGTIENPYNTLAAAEAGSSDDNIIFVHSGSTLAGNFTTKNGQRVLGEGLDPNGIFIDHTVNSAEQGLVSLPETSLGSQDITAPVITGAGTVFDLTDRSGNEINNFVINGGVTAVSANLANAPQLANLDINNPTGDAIIFTDVTGSSLIENSVAIDGAGGRAIFIDGGSGVIGANAVITNSTDFAVEVRDRTGGSITFGEITDTGLGLFVHDNTGGSITFSSQVDLNTGANPAVQLSDNSGSTITLQQLQATASGVNSTFIVTGGGTISVNDPNSNIINTGTGSALVVSGDNGAGSGNPSLTILADIMNSSGGQAVDIQDMTGGAVSITGDITDNDTAGSGILVQDNTGGTFSFAGTTTLDTGANSAVMLQDNDGATITFSNLNATAAGGDTFVVNGGGTITVNDPNDTGIIANTAGGIAVLIRGDTTFDGNPSVNFGAEIVNTGSGMSVNIEDMTGGGVTFSDLVTDTDGGVLVQNNTGGTIIFTDTLTVDTGSNDAVSLISNTGATLSFNGLDIMATGAQKGFTATGGGTLIVTNVNPTLISSAAGTALELDGMTIDVGNVTFDTVDQTAGTSLGVILKDLDGTGAVTVGADTITPGTIVSSMGGVLIDGGSNVITVNTDIATTGGRSLEVMNRIGGTVLVNGDISDTGGTGINLASNTGGGVNITSELTLNTGVNDAITIAGNDGAAIDFTGTSSIDLGTTTGIGIHLTGTNTNVDIDADITGGTGTTIDVEGDATLTVDGNITNTAGRSVHVHNLTAGNVDFNGDITDTGTGILLESNSGGTVDFAGTTSVTTTGTDNAVTHTNNSGTTITYNELTASADDGHTFAVQGGGTITVNDNGAGSTISNAGTGNALFVQGDQADTDPPMDDFDGNPTLTVSADIDNTFDGRVASIRRMTGGSVTLNGTITDDAFGVLIEDNTGGTINVNGQVTLNTAANDALTIQTNGSGNTINFNASSQLNIDTTTGTGIVINGPGTVNINGTGNTVDSTMGVGIDITNAGNTTINNTTVNAGAANAVNISHTSGAASDVTLNNVTVASATANIGVNVSADGPGEFDLTMDNVDISGVGLQGVLFDTGANADRVDFTITNSLIVAGDDNAFLATLNDSNTADVRFLIDESQFSNSSATAATVDIFVNSEMTLNATIGQGVSNENLPTAPIGDRNRFVNSTTNGDAFLAEIDNASGTLNLDLRDNTAQSSGTGLDFGITNTNGTFNLVDATDTINDDNNVGDVIDTGTIDPIAPPLLMPTP